ncbi:pyridoxamine 5'-phosphate oxidase family protein [Nostoc sphaeroides]|uniref:Phosphate oxidase family protein n=1 Tax=Nostoc sphaeroides CCNUC1 TaxID=2653204 RepID=A0A5P8WAQ5_9NOSO|nr:pyridoxamine 5'-phosphate oxidase family protein [Nostoc sphaeroides]QFS49672.1 phosphate oxidase family protein [Nostoc sphaeroides CCNUC1]
MGLTPHKFANNIPPEAIALLHVSEIINADILMIQEIAGYEDGAVMTPGESASAANGWVNTIDSNSPEVIANARDIIANNLYCTLSTCSVDGFPWASPVFFAYDDSFNIYWSSAIAAQHSQNIYSNHGRVTIAIFYSKLTEGSSEGLYFKGFAFELSQDHVEKAFNLLSLRAKKPIPRTAADYLDNSPRRIYQFQPQQVWITGSRLPVGNQLVDTKIQINLPNL